MELNKQKRLSENKNKQLNEVCAVMHFVDFNTLSESGEETYRTFFRRQRDRILYSGGFRRLQDKTQVMAALEDGDHRTRLTHTLEVEQIALSIASALSLNEDLVSAIALGHDVGHTPFGHAAERVLNEKLKNCGGFNHALQSVRYLQYKNIKLSKEVFHGILMHDTDVVKKHKDITDSNIQIVFTEHGLKPNIYPSLEGQIVHWADKLAYLTHDLEDYRKNIYDSNSINPKQKTKLNNCLKALSENKCKGIDSYKTRDLIRGIISNLIEESFNRIEKIKKFEKNKETGDIEHNKEYLEGLTINLSAEYREIFVDLRKLIDDLYIKDYKIQFYDAKAKKIVSSLYDTFIENTNLLPTYWRRLLDFENCKDVIIKFIINALKRDRKSEYLRKIIIDYSIYNSVDDIAKNIDTHYHDLALFVYFDFVGSFNKDNNLHKEIKEEIEKKGKEVEKADPTKQLIIADYISSMTDKYATKLYSSLMAVDSKFYI